MNYEDDYELSLEDRGLVSLDEIPDLGDCRKFLNRILRSVYKTGNISELEDSLDELCGLLDVNTDASLTPVITNKYYISEKIKKYNFINKLTLQNRK